MFGLLGYTDMCFTKDSFYGWNLLNGGEYCLNLLNVRRNSLYKLFCIHVVLENTNINYYNIHHKGLDHIFKFIMQISFVRIALDMGFLDLRDELAPAHYCFFFKVHEL